MTFVKQHSPLSSTEWLIQVSDSANFFGHFLLSVSHLTLWLGFAHVGLQHDVRVWEVFLQYGLISS